MKKDYVIPETFPEEGNLVLLVDKATLKKTVYSFKKYNSIYVNYIHSLINKNLNSYVY